MTDYGHELKFGTFITPSNQHADRVVAAAVATERSGLDLATFQDHPYNPGMLDAWTLIAFAAARTERIALSGNVLNVPLRQPAVLARSVASLDLLSKGRIELGLGAGAFWDGIAAMGGDALTPGQAVDALSEAIEIIRGIWDASAPGGVRVDGHTSSGYGCTARSSAGSQSVALARCLQAADAVSGRAQGRWVAAVASLSEVADGRGVERDDRRCGPGGRT